MSHLSAQFIPPVSLDSAGDMPLYQQLSSWFKRAISAGTLRPGQRVPSTRDLASALNVSRISVFSAYELLTAEGYFRARVGVGTCVSEAIPAALLPSRTDDRATGGAPLPIKVRRTISRRAELMRAQSHKWMEDAVESHPGMGVPDEFPIGIWSRLVGRHARQISSDTMGYGDPKGLPPFRRALAQYLGAFRGVCCDEEQILVTTGSQQALQICALATLDPGDRAWVEEPGYPGARQAVTAAGGQAIPVPVDSEGLDVDWGLHRDNRVRSAFVTPCHQFPLGVPLSAARRLALLDWAHRRGAWIVEDDYDSEGGADGSSFASLQNMDADGRVIYIGSLSSVMFPSLRLGYIVVPKDLAETFVAVRNASDIFPSPLYQQAMTDFMQEGHLSRRIRRMHATHVLCRRTLTAALHNDISDVLELLESNTGTRLLGLLPLGVSDCEVAHRIAVTGLRIKALSPCYRHPPARGGLILDYTNFNPAATHDAVRSIGTAVRQYVGLHVISVPPVRKALTPDLHPS